MPTNPVLRTTIFILSIPFILISRIAFLCKSQNLITDFNKCSELIRHTPPASEVFINTLIIAEDHRNELHLGIDPIAILRCCFILITSKKPQGGSTIEQQLVRVILGRYERTITRKLREQIIAIEVCRNFEKHQIASTYLSLAFYGTKQRGLESARKALNPSIRNIEIDAALFVISKLKYPEPLTPSKSWIAKISNRVQHIRNKASEANRISSLARNSLNPIKKSTPR